MGKNLKKIILLFSIILVSAFFTQSVLAASRAEIWDDGSSAWTTTFANGDPVDNGTANNADSPQVAVDSNGIVYVTFIQFRGISNHIYLSRYNGTNAEIWDKDTASWTTTFANGDPIDLDGLTGASAPQIAIDSLNRVYVTFIQSNGSENHIYLSRYNGTNVEIWDSTPGVWTTIFANGTGIDTGVASSASAPQLAIDSVNNVYVTYLQSVHVYLSRYDGTSVKVWDNNTSSWTTTFANGDPIDNSTMILSLEPQIAIDSANNVYITYTQDAAPGGHVHIFLSRYDSVNGVQIWDNDTVSWTTTFANGDPIDTGITSGAGSPQLAIDSTGRVYVTFGKYNVGGIFHIYLSRYNGTDVRIWDNDTTSWTTTFANGDPIDTGTANNASFSQLAIDSAGRVYVTYEQNSAGSYYIYLSRYDGTDVRIWDNNTVSWTTTFANGDPIDTGSAVDFAATPQLVIDSTGKVYVTYVKGAGIIDNIFLSRYNGTNAEIWDNGVSGWTTTFANGDPIASDIVGAASVPQIGIDSTNRAYVTYRQPNTGGVQHVYLSRYTGNSIDPPTITSSAASSVSTSSAVLNGDITATGGENNTVRGFEYGLTTAYGTATSTTGSYGTGAFTADITGLTPNTTYHYRSYSTNSAGTSSSTDQSFVTLANIPTALISDSTTATRITMSWNANSNPEGTEYNIINNLGTNSGWSEINGLIFLSLTPNTSYGFAVRARNSENSETAYTATTTVVTLANIPTTLTATVDSSTQITASWNANLNPGTTEYYVTNITAGTNSGWITAFSYPFTGLLPFTSYDFVVKARNSMGTTTLDTATTTVSTNATLPTVIASSASNITSALATLNGNITATGGENNTVRGFEYGLTTGYGSISSTTGSYSTGIFTADITGLTPNTTYHFRAFSVNSAGTATSSDVSFTTNDVSHSSGGSVPSVPPPIVIPPVTPPVIIPPVFPPPSIITPEIPTTPPLTQPDNDGAIETLATSDDDNKQSEQIKAGGNSNPNGVSVVPKVSSTFIDSIGLAIVDSYSRVKKVIESKTGSAVTKIITTTGVVGGGVAVTSAFVVNGTVMADLFSLPFKLWGLLLSIFGLKRRNRPWGTVYDSVTKQPIDPAYVTLKNLNSNEENTSITDLDGRYGFFVTPGKYILEANKTNYIFPSKKLSGKSEDELYNNLYSGGEINIEADNAVIGKNIPLDPIKFDWNEFVKGKKKLMRFYSQREKIIKIITDWMFRIGFVVSVVSLFLVPAPYNLVIFFLYVLLVILRKFGLRQKVLGSLTEGDGNPLSFAIVRVFDSELNVEITNKVADKIGRYYCLVSKGSYYVKVEKKNDDESYSVVHTSEIFEAENGIINRSFEV